MGEAEEEGVRLQNNLEEKCNQSSLPHGSPTRKPQEFVQKNEDLWVYEKHGHFCFFPFQNQISPLPVLEAWNGGAVLGLLQPSPHRLAVYSVLKAIFRGYGKSHTVSKPT